MIAQLTMDVRPVEIDGKHWVDVSMNGHALPRRGPFPNANAAKTAANRLIQHWQPNTPTVPTTSVILHGNPVELDSDMGRRFVTDATRAGEGLLTDETLQEIYEITPENWANIAKNTTLINAIRDERMRRVRNGQAAREAAQQHFVKAPAVLNSIMSDERASARHRIESARELRATAIGGDNADRPAETERFIIKIDLSAAPGGTVETYDKSIAPKTNDVDPEQLTITVNPEPLEDKSDA